MKRGARNTNAVLSFALLLIGLATPNVLFRATDVMSASAKAQSISSSSQGSSESEARRVLRDLTSRLAELSTLFQLSGRAERFALRNELEDLASQRREMLLELMESDPGEVLRVALPDEMRAGMPAAIRDQIEQRVELEGELEVMYECWEESSRLHYSLGVAGERLSLHFAGAPLNLLSGSKVSVKGVRVDQDLALQPDSEGLQISGRSGFETMAMAVAPNTFGQQKVLVLLVNFQDKQTQPFTISQVESTVFTSANNFYKESSYQQTWLTGDVFGWYTLPISSASCDQYTIATYAKQAATAAGVNLSAYNRYVYAFPSISCGWTGWGTYGGNPSQAWINGSMSLRTVAHELGHNFGLYHARALECGSQVIGTSCTTVEYGDILDILGKSGVTGHSHAHQKERAGWLGYGASPALTTVQTSGTYWLEPYETVGTNPKALKILKSVDPTTGKKTWYYVEFRRPVGFDSFISSNNNVMNGVMVHTGTEAYSFDLYLLDMTPETTSWSDAALVVGRSYNDPNINVTITPESVSNTGAAVNVSFGEQPCVRANPSMSLSPSQSQWVAAGTTVTYTVSVTNRDSSGCAASSFNLQASVPTGWSASFASSVLDIGPGATGATTLEVTSPMLAVPGLYDLGITAADSGDEATSTSSSVTYALMSAPSLEVSANQSSYTLGQTASITALLRVTGTPVSGASVAFAVTRPNGVVKRGSATTGTNGAAVFTYKFNRKQDPVGQYNVTATATVNGLSVSGSTSFALR